MSFLIKKTKRQGNIYWRYFSWPKNLYFTCEPQANGSPSQFFPPLRRPSLVLTVWPEDYRIWGCAAGHSVILCSVINQLPSVGYQRNNTGGCQQSARHHYWTIYAHIPYIHTFSHSFHHFRLPVTKLTKKPRCTALKIKSAF